MIWHFGEETNLTEKQELAIGSFDALHYGHQKLFSYLSSDKSMITLFNPLPAQVFQKNFPGCVYSFAQRCELASSLEVVNVLQIDFSREFSRMLGDEFLAVVCRCLPLGKIVVGEGFCMGRDRSFTVQHLKDWSKVHDVDIIEVPLQEYQGRRFSTGAIRQAVQQADFDQALTWMGHPYALDLRGLPSTESVQKCTVDLTDSVQILPPDGLYQIQDGQVEIQGKTLTLSQVVDQCVFKKKLN